MEEMQPSFSGDTIVSAELISHFIEQLFCRHHSSEEHVNRLQGRLVHPFIEAGITVTRKSHLIVSEETRPCS